MYLIEIALAAVRGFSPQVRVALRPGYLVLEPPTSAPPAPPSLAALFTAVCFSDGRGGEASFLAPDQKHGKVAFTLLGNDQATYRLMRELGGPGALHKLNPVSKSFDQVSSDAGEIGQFLRGQVGLPSKNAMEQLFSFTAAQLPTRRPRPKAMASDAPARAASLPSAQPARAAGDVGAAQGKLAELEKELQLAKTVDGLQYELDGVSSQLYELEGVLKQADGVKAALQEAESAFQRAPTPEGLRLPADIISRAEGYQSRLQRRDDSLAKLGDPTQEELEAPPPAPATLLWKDPRFLGGVAAGIAFFVTGAMLQGYARFVALLDIPAFGFAALVALKYVETLQASQHVSKKGDMRERREKKIREEFETDAQHVKAALKLLDVDSPEQVVAVLSQKPLLAEKVKEFKAQLSAIETNPDYASAAKRQQALRVEQERLNQRLLEQGGYLRAATEVEKELVRVRESLALAAGPAAVVGALPAATGEGDKLEDPFPLVMKLGAELFLVEIPALVTLLKDRPSQYLSALTDRRYMEVEFSADGRATFKTSTGKVPATELPGKDLDVAYLAVRLALVERFGAKAKVPVFIEDALTAVEEAKQPLAARMLKHLGSVTQVLHVSSQPAFTGAADGAVKL